jgi:hypothetical protein
MQRLLTKDWFEIELIEELAQSISITFKKKYSEHYIDLRSYFSSF